MHEDAVAVTAVRTREKEGRSRHLLPTPRKGGKRSKIKAEMVGGSIGDGRTRRTWDFDARMVEKPQDEGGTATLHRRARGRVVAAEGELTGRERPKGKREESKRTRERQTWQNRGKNQGRRGREDPNQGTTSPAQRHSAQHKTLYNLGPSCPFFIVTPMP